MSSDLKFEVRNIVLQNGRTLSVSMTPKFLEIVREHYHLGEDAFVEDKYIKMYFYGAFNNAIEGAEDDKKQHS